MNRMKQWVMARRPDGLVTEDDFELQDTNIPEIKDGEVLLKTLYLGLAPVMLRYMTNETDFEPPMEIGDVMKGRGVGRVVKSRNPDFQEGDVVQCKMGWREFAVIDSDPYYMAFKMHHTDLPLSYGASSLAMSGYTALIGMRDICRAKPGEKTLVSGAAGGVGSQVGFIAKSMGCDPVIGIAGGPEKCKLLVDRLGYDAAIDYKNDDVPAKLDEHFPEGVDVFFDNVGGELLDEVLGRIRRRARIAICGRISEYLKDRADYHRPRNIYRIGLMDSKMEGFFVYDYTEHFAEYDSILAGWIRDGTFKPLEDMMEGLENMPKALISLYKGTNTGIRVVRIDPNVDADHR